MQVIDSCATSNGGCDHLCRHGVGGPVCSCHQGYQLQADGRSCEGNRFPLQFASTITHHSALKTIIKAIMSLI